MLTLDVSFKQALAKNSLSLCWCWLITRIDGYQLGFTSLDVPFIIDNVEYRPFTGYDASASQSSLELNNVDSQQMKGILDISGISKADLDAGVYELAKVRRFLVNYEDLPNTLNRNPPKHLELASGYLAESKQNSLGYEIKVKDDWTFLDSEIVNVTSKTCRAELGNDVCRVDLMGFSHNLTVTSVQSQRAFTVDGNLPDTYFDRGRLLFTSGANLNFHRDIGFYTDQTIILFPVSAPREIVVGDTITAVAGCRKTELDCIVKFQNFGNFAGEPDLPTTDVATDTPIKD